MNTSFLIKNKRSVVGLLLFGILLLGLLLVVLAAKRAQDLRQRATTQEGNVHIVLEPGSTTFTPGEHVSLDIMATNLDATQIDAFQVFLNVFGQMPSDLSFEPAQIEGMYPAGFFDEGSQQTVFMTSDENGATISFIQIGSVQGQNIIPYTPTGNSVKLGTILFTAPDSGEITFEFQDQTKVQPHNVDGDLAGPAQTFTYTFADAGPTATPEESQEPTARPTTVARPTPTPRSTPESTPQTPGVQAFNIRTVIAGITDDRGPIRARVHVAPHTWTQPLVSDEIVLVFDNGYYVGRVETPNGEPLPNMVWIAVKGQKHLQRLFSGIELSEDEQIVDLVDKPLQPGDLPEQDGTIDIEDINTMLSIFAKPDQTVEDINTGDLNFDGVVNAADLALLLATLTSKPDEVIP